MSGRLRRVAVLQRIVGVVGVGAALGSAALGSAVVANATAASAPAATPTLAQASAAPAKACRLESLCRKFKRGYRNNAGEQVRVSLDGVDLALFETAEAEARIRRVFERARALLLEVIQSEEMLPNTVRESMRLRVQHTGLKMVSQGQSPYAANFWFDSWEVLVDRSVAELPEANLINLFAHELAHSFDLESNAYSLIRENAAIFANLDDRNPPRAGVARETLATPIDEADFYPLTYVLGSKGIQYDHFMESMCDRFAAQVSRRYLEALPQDARSIAALEGQLDLIVMACNQPKLIDQVQRRYPSIRTRVEILYFDHPGISEAAGCANSISRGAR